MKKLTVMVTTIVMFLATMINVYAYDPVKVKIKVKGDPKAVIQITSEDSPLPNKPTITLNKKGKGTFHLSFDEPEPDDYHYTITRTDKEGFKTYHVTVQLTNNNQNGLDKNVAIADENGNKTCKPKFITPKPKPTPSDKPSKTEKPEPTEKPKPTDKPADTPKPTEKPTDKPTETPTTPTPTVKPSEKPVKPITPEPTVKPSDKPSQPDTPKPSETPVIQPSEEPTVSPEPSKGTEVVPVVPTETPSVKPSPKASEKPETVPEKPSETKSPDKSSKTEEAVDTGDHSNTGMMLVLFAGALIAITAVTVIRKRQSD